MGSDVAEDIERSVVILPWGNDIEDFLDPIGLSLEQFCAEMTGGWLFGFSEALKLCGWRVSILCVSRGVREIHSRIHTPTGTEIVFLPSPRLYRLVRACMNDVYTFSPPTGARGLARIGQWARAMLRALAPYLANPLFDTARALRRMRPDVVLCQEYEYARFDVIAAMSRLLRFRYAATFQGGQYTFSGLEALVRSWSVRSCSVLVIASAEEAERVHNKYRIDSRRVASIPNPLDLGRWPAIDRNAARKVLGWPALARVAICHGRIDIRRKGLDILIEAWRRIVAGQPAADVRLILVGDGADAAALQLMLDADHVRGLDWHRAYVLDRSVISQFLHAADVYVMASRQEGFPVAPLEAMACGLPVVTTDAPGLAEIVVGAAKPVGFLVPREEPAALADALSRLLLDPGLSIAWGKNARTYVGERFSLKAVGQLLAESLGTATSVDSGERTR
jgi:glycosyltransferase involved in cell wall biosynthesis